MGASNLLQSIQSLKTNRGTFEKKLEKLTYLMDEREHGRCYFEPEEMEMGQLKYRTQNLFFHDHGTHVAVPWMERESLNGAEESVAS